MKFEERGENLNSAYADTSLRLSPVGQYLMKFEERGEALKGKFNCIDYNLVTWLSHNPIYIMHCETSESV